MCARANARCNDNTDALSHAHTFTQPRIEHRLRSLSEFNDPSTRPSRAPPHHRSQSFPSPTPRAHSRSRVPQHTTFYLSLTSRVFFVSRSLPPPRRPPPFSFYNAGYISPLLTPILPSSSRTPHCSTIPYTLLLLFFRFTVSPELSLLLIFSSPIPSSSCPSCPFLLASFLPSRPFPSRRPSSATGTLVNRHGSPCGTRLLLSFLPFFFHHLSRERNALLGAVERERESATSERREPGGRGSERERETPFLAAATRNGISRTDNGPFRGLLPLVLAAVGAAAIAFGLPKASCS